jgi:uncharacterized protein with PQ loop repeat
MSIFFLWCYLVIGVLIAVDVNTQSIRDGHLPITVFDWIFIVSFWPILWLLGIFLE